MALATCLVADQSASVICQNMAKIKLLIVAGPLLCHPAQAHRVVQLLENRFSWSIERPSVMLAVHSDDEQAAAEQFKSGTARDLARYVIVRQKGHNETGVYPSWGRDGIAAAMHYAFGVIRYVLQKRSLPDAMPAGQHTSG